MSRVNPEEQARRDQEVLRANREFAAYFKGRRTEREARAALKSSNSSSAIGSSSTRKVRPPLPGVTKPAAESEPAKERQRRASMEIVQ